MKVYATEQIRNVVILGHGRCGKTTLTEGLAYLAGVTSRLGRVDDGNTISDFDKEEIKRKFSIHTSLVALEWNNVKFNLLDTPGYFDFVGEVEEACGVADAALIVVSAKAGIESGTKKAWELCEKYNLPRMIYVSDMDDNNASYREVVEALIELYGKRITPIYSPIRENEAFVGYINVVRQGARRWLDKGQREEIEIPEYSRQYLDQYREALLEAVAETSEEYMERFFAGEEFTENEIRLALRNNTIAGDMVPVCMGCAPQLQGLHNLLNDMVSCFPSPKNKKLAGINRSTNAIYEADYDFAKAKTVYVFKTMVDPFIGKYSLIKVGSGVLKAGDTLYHAELGQEEKIGKLYLMEGNKPVEIGELNAGDIGALAKLVYTETGDTLSTKATPVTFAKTEISKPYTVMRYHAVNKGDEDKISQALNKLMQEDLTLKAVNDSENRQSLLYGIGDQHLEVVVSKLLERYKVQVELEKPLVSFKETIRKDSDVEYKYKKQSGGHGQYGHVKMRFSPSNDFENPFVFEQEVVGGAVPKNYFPAVEKGLQESVLAGPLAGYPVVGVKAVLYDGSYHPVDSSEMAFKMASIQAFKKGFMEAKPVLLEPIAVLKVRIPDECAGDIMGDINKRRGRVLGMNPVGNQMQVIEADIPMAELFGYATVLRAATGGMGEFSYEFTRYEQAPADVQEKEVTLRAKKDE